MGELPTHIGIIMDGNRRWAKNRGLAANEGHRQGVEALERLVKASIKEKVKVITVYALSTENIKERGKNEIEGLLSLIRNGFVNKLPVLKKEGVEVNFFGDTLSLPLAVRKILERTKRELSGNKNLVLNICLNYGSRAEIVTAVKNLVGGEITEEIFAKNLYTRDYPDPELIIRTGGQKRLSNFLLWQAAYSELYFTDKLWPDFDEVEFQKALEEFALRKRNFGV